MSHGEPHEAPAGDGLYGLEVSVGEAGVVIVPAPFDATTSYRPGAARGPEAVRVASAQVDLHDREVGDPWRAGIALTAPDPEIAHLNAAARPLVEALATGQEGERVAADLRRVNELCRRCNDLLEEEVRRRLETGKLVGLLGGDHATAFGSIRAHAAFHGPFGILHVDAHADLRRAYQGFEWSHASVMEAVTRMLPEVTRLVQVGVRDFCDEERERIEDSGGRIRTFFDADLAAERFAGRTWAAQVDDIVGLLPEQVYVSFDIDGLDPKLCPHTGTPVPGGLDFRQAAFLLGAVVRSGRRIVGFDLVEVAPGPAGDEWDGNVGARVLYQLIGWALKSRPAQA